MDDDDEWIYRNPGTVYFWSSAMKVIVNDMEGVNFSVRDIWLKFNVLNVNLSSFYSHSNLIYSFTQRLTYAIHLIWNLEKRFRFNLRFNFEFYGLSYTRISGNKCMKKYILMRLIWVNPLKMHMSRRVVLAAHYLDLLPHETLSDSVFLSGCLLVCPEDKKKKRKRERAKARRKNRLSATL